MTAPTGVVTFLFTDIEGSTRRWEADADAMRSALQAHDGVLREAVEAHGGWLFKHTGDGMCAAFASPSAAVDAAIEAQLTLELPVRMGIATGEAELRECDYYGPVLNRAARVMACGHGGQILLDGATALLINGFDFIELGPRRLRDLAHAVDLFQVRAAGLRTDFSPLQTLDSSPGNLRPQTTSFVGRDRELVEVQAELTAHRLVTLTGVGGVGKTRLALEVAARVANSFPDGVWMIELAAISDPAAVPEAVAAAMGITQQPGSSLTQSIAAALESRSRLLVLDNCEHILDAVAELIEAIFAHSATVKVLATSREALRTRDERLWPVPSLQIGADSAATTLFTERSEAVASAISSVHDVGAIVEICRRLDGIPLAIELAASRMQSMTVSEVRDRLDDRFRLLVGSRRGLERHQTLRHAVQWSYDLLDEAEQTLLERCSVFAGGFDLTSACAVAGSGSDAKDEFVTLDLLGSLVRKSLLVADRTAERTRFSMLETIRQFAEELLAQHGLADEMRAAHSYYFAERDANLLALWDSPRQREAYTWFHAELPNLRTAFRWAADHDDLDNAAAIATYAGYLGNWVELYEPLAWAEELIEPARAVRHPRLAQLYAVASQCYAPGRFENAIGYIEAGEEAIASGHFERIPYEFEAPFMSAYIFAGQPQRAIDWCRDIVGRGPGMHPLAQACLVLALAVSGAGDEAVAASNGLLAAAEAVDNPGVASLALVAYGWALRDADPAAAYEVLRRGLAIAEESGNRQVESTYAVGLARLAATHGDARDALDFLTVAIRQYYDSGSFFHMAGPLTSLAGLFDQLGHQQPAAIVSGFAATPINRQTYPEINGTIVHLREVLGDDAYEAHAHAGAEMTNAAMATYAFDHIDQARAELQ